MQLTLGGRAADLALAEHVRLAHQDVYLDLSRGCRCEGGSGAECKHRDLKKVKEKLKSERFLESVSGQTCGCCVAYDTARPAALAPS